MAERLNHFPEDDNDHEANPYGNPEDYKKTPETAHAHEIKDGTEKLEEISKKIEKEAKSSKELDISNETSHQKPSYHHNGPYHEHSGSQAIKRVQKHLKPAERRFSKVIHNPKVEIVSDITGSTIARPSGLLYGGLFSLLSSLALYLLSRHYGYEYSYFVGILFFVGGFVFGLLIESLLRIFKKSAR